MSTKDLYSRMDSLEEKLLELIEQTKMYSVKDPEGSMNKARQIAEAVCISTIVQHNLAKDKAPTELKYMIDMLRHKHEAMPDNILANVEVIQRWGNMGSHFNQHGLSLKIITPALEALANLVEWFFAKNDLILPERVILSDRKEQADLPQTGLRSNMTQPRAGFVGRETELEEMHRLLQAEGNVFVCGMGGIGKSQLVKKYAQEHEAEYDVRIFANYSGSLRETIASDSQVPITDMERGAMPIDAYYRKKMDVLRTLSNGRTLIVIDNFDVSYDEVCIEDLNELLDGEYKLIVTSRTDFEEYGMNVVKVDALEQQEQLRQIFFNNYGRKLAAQEFEAVDRLIELLGRHTMAIEIMAKQMAKSRKMPSEMIHLLQGKGLHTANFRERVYHEDPRDKKTGYEILKALFSLESLTEEEQKILSDLALVPNSGIDTVIFHDWCGLESYEEIDSLIQRNWILHDVEEDVIHLHPLVSEIVMGELVREFPYESRMMQKSFFSNYRGGNTSWIESAEIIEQRAAVILRVMDKFPQVTVQNEDQYFVMAITLSNHGGYREHVGAMLEAVARERFKKYERFSDEIFEVMFHLNDHSPRCRKNWVEFEKMCFENINYLTAHDQNHLAAQFCLAMGYSSIERGDSDRVKNYMKLAEQYYHMISPDKDRCAKGLRGMYSAVPEAFGGNIYHFLARAALTIGDAEQSLDYELKAEKILMDRRIYIDEKTKDNVDLWIEMNRQSIAGAFGRIYTEMKQWDLAKKYLAEKEEMLLKYRRYTHYHFMPSYAAMIRIEQHLGNADKVAEYKQKLKKLLDANYLPEEKAYRILAEEFELDA